MNWGLGIGDLGGAEGGDVCERRKYEIRKEEKGRGKSQLRITNHNYESRITNHESRIRNYESGITQRSVNGARITNDEPRAF